MFSGTKHHTVEVNNLCYDTVRYDSFAEMKYIAQNSWYYFLWNLYIYILVIIIAPLK